MKEDDKWVENLRNKLEDYSEPLPDAFVGKVRGGVVCATRHFQCGGHVALLQLLFWS